MAAHWSPKPCSLSSNLRGIANFSLSVLSVGRRPALEAGGRRFEPYLSDQIIKKAPKVGDKKYAFSARKTAIKYKYGLTWSQFEDLHRTQSGRCQICHKPLSLSAHPEIETAYVDHNHITGKIRGILCRVCNVGLGHFQDSRLHLEQAIKYLDSYDNG